jgi:hypothetical protein
MLLWRVRVAMRRLFAGVERELLRDQLPGESMVGFSGRGARGATGGSGAKAQVSFLLAAPSAAVPPGAAPSATSTSSSVCASRYFSSKMRGACRQCTSAVTA